MTGPAYARPAPGGTRLDLKVVPGGARDQIVGPHGERLRVKVSRPAAGGQANRALLALLAGALGVPARDLEITAGHASTEKRVLVSGLAPAEAVRLLAEASSGPGGARPRRR